MSDIVLCFYLFCIISLAKSDNIGIMLLVLLKSIFTFVLIFFVVRLMGKRQLGEMQPFELVITLIIAEVACIPMNDPYIPFYYGVVPIVTLSFLQILFSYLSKKFLPVRRLVSGRAVIVIDKDGINYDNLSRLNMNANDLMEAVRSAGYADLNEIQYAVIETNGKICVLEKSETEQVFLPLAIIINGKWQERNVQYTGLDKQSFLEELMSKNLKLSEVVYADVRQNGEVYVAPENGKCQVAHAILSKGGQW